jgi:hypothetical protein
VYCCITIKKRVLAKNVRRYSCTPHCLKYQRPTHEMKCDATRIPYSAGIKTPSFLIEGENTCGNVNTIVR